MGFKRYKMLQKYINGEAIEQYKQGELIDDTVYSTLDACNEGNQKPDEPIEGDIYQWLTVSGEYVCNGGNKYTKEKEQKSSNNGVSWTDTGRTRQGELIEVGSDDCDFVNKYLTTEHITNGTVQIHRYVSNQDYSDRYPLTNIQYSKNGGAWTSISYDTDISVNSGDKIKWKANANVNDGVYNTCYTVGGTQDNVMSIFKGTSDFNVSGNIKSIIYNDDFRTIDETGKTIQLSFLFFGSSQFGGNSCVVSAEKLIMPANIHRSRSMFDHQTKLTTAPELPATTMASWCYQGMFNGCTSLTTAPVLPATTLAAGCYQSMFSGCTSLTTAPVLPVTTLVNMCYESMFARCTRLTSITCLATDISAFNCTYNWVNNVSASGTFTKASSMTSWTTGTNGIPSGWNVING